MKEWTAPANIESIPFFMEEINRELDALGCSRLARRKINVALDELLCNIASYAYGRESGEMTAQLRYDEDSRTVSISLIDSGIAYNPLEKEDPDITLCAEKRPVGGLGILIVKKKMDKTEYRREDGRNILTIYKRIQEDGDNPGS